MVLTFKPNCKGILDLGQRLQPATTVLGIPGAPRASRLDTVCGRIYDETMMGMQTTTPAERTEGLRAAMRAWTTGVAIVTAAHNGQQHGMTVSSFASISLDPPLVAISLQTASHTHALVSRAGAFGVTMLAVSQKEISERFAGRNEDQEARLEGLETETLATGAPLIKGGLAFLDCRVTQTIQAGTNTLFIAEVVAVQAEDREAPLVYHDRTYRRLQD
jgi:flavin reductase (DIM6/NTAB) family NADH-FMN oxidoreductase RutF